MPASSRPPRSSGILLHPTSLPGPYGIGDLGPGAHAWVEALARARQGWWQILPLGPTGYGDSPYQCFSAFAGNANLISPELLMQEGLLRPAKAPEGLFPATHVEYERVVPHKEQLLNRAWQNFQAGRAPHLRPEFEAFCAQESEWLEDFALFTALKDTHPGGVWTAWDAHLVSRDRATLARAGKDLGDLVGHHRFTQFLFFRQWHALKAHAHALGVQIIGDVPIFAAQDSADLWAHPELFHLDAQGQPTVVAGVPPDYFSVTGQRWGNPLYDWAALKKTGYAWWTQRLRATHRLVDRIRIDHFVGFENYWEIQADCPTAEKGRWVKGPGMDLFDTLARALGELPLIAEDLGIVTPEVEALRRRYHFPGMRVLQFAFGGQPEARFLPFNFEPNTVVYTGTHDNDTARGWWASISPQERQHLESYLGQKTSLKSVSWQLLHLAWSSVADLVIAPLQDVLSLGTEARMNLPGAGDGNWRWRYQTEQLTGDLLERLAGLTTTFGRGPETRGNQTTLSADHPPEDPGRR